MKPKRVRVSLKIPFLAAISGDWELDDIQRRAAWELYVEIITRISTVELRPNEGLLREALSSLYSLFGTTRTILRTYGPGVAPASDRPGITLGGIAIAMLNGVIRPTLTRWHPALLQHEAKRPANVSPFAHEQDWDLASDLRGELNEVRRVLIETAQILGEVTGAANLLPLASDSAATLESRSRPSALGA
jgi:hypothetical protein